MPQTLYLLDGHSQLFVAYHALEPLTAPDGTPTGAAYGFLRTLRKIIAGHAPDHLAVVFDPPGRTFRHESFADYKANRPDTPHDFRHQLQLTKELLAAWPIPVLEVEGYEADDTLATLARRHASPDLKVVLVTLDKDCRQLLEEGRIEIFDARRDSFMTERKLEEKQGITPAQVVDYLTMVGDASDNVPGIPLIGKKKAATLLSRYGTLEACIEHAAEVGGKTGENLAAARETAFEHRELVRLRDDVEVDLSLGDCLLRKPDAERLAPILRRLGFIRLLSELGVAEPTIEVEPAQVTDSHALEAFQAAIATLSPEDAVAIRPLWTGSARRPLWRGLGISWREGEAWYLPLDDAGELPLEPRWALARQLLGPQGPRKIGHGLGSDHQALASAGVDLAPIGFDSQLATYLLAPTRSDYGLVAVATTHIGEVLPRRAKEADLGGLFDDLELEARAERAGREAEVCWRLGQLLPQYIESRGLGSLLAEIELPLLSVLSRMEARGISLDRDKLAALERELAGEIRERRAECVRLAGVEFNVDSPRQLAEVLFETLALPTSRRTKTGYSTDAAVLEELADKHPLPAAVLAYRQLVKLQNTYVEALPKLVDSSSGRLHTHFLQAATATGRLASEHPNLQNIPIRTPLGRRIRRAFVAPEGKRLVAADYSQIELRVLAHTSGDPALIEAFRQGKDIHRAVAARIAGVDEAQVDADTRRRAKTVNFGIIYGQTPFGLARELGISQGEAREFIDRYFERFPRVKAWIDEVIQAAKRAGEVRTLFGRVRQLPEINSRNFGRRGFAERTAVNTIVQGTAADLIKIAMIRVDERLRREGLGAQLLLSIHDELLFEVDADEVEDLQALVTEEMTGAMQLEVPLTVDIGCGADWLEAGGKDDAPPPPLSAPPEAAAPPVIGIVGGIASGKSAVAAAFGEQGCEVIDADKLAHAALTEPAILDAIAARWPSVIEGEGAQRAVQRKALGEIVFADPDALEQLEALVHPRVREQIIERLQAAAVAGRPAVLDVPLLIEGPLAELCDAIVLVETSVATRAARAAARGWDADELARREREQAPLADKAAAADYTIDNNDQDGAPPALAPRVAQIMQAIERGQAAEVAAASAAGGTAS